jgi:membrane protease YdiL (CAAX protease family)
MSGPDEQNPIDNQELPNSDAPGDERPSDSEPSEPAAFVLPSIPILPPRPISAPASRALAFGDELIDLTIAPFLPSNAPSRLPNQATADHLTEALRTESPSSDADSAPQEYPAPDFRITPLAPFTATVEPDFTPAALQNLSPQPDAAYADTHAASSNLDVALAGTHATHAQVESLGAPGLASETWESNKVDPPYASPVDAPPLFRLQPEPESRIPNFGHLALLAVIALFGFVAAGMAVQIALRFHLWGVTNAEKAVTDIHYTLASMAVLYGVSFAVAFFLFPHLWHKPFFAGLQWNFPAAIRYRHWLFAAASFCFLLAIVDEFFLPGPSNAPIDKMFSNSAAAWLLFAFGVTVAPFFEELTFRGFLLPALCTAVDWAVGLRTKEPPPPLATNGHPQWSIAAMIIGSLLTSLPFAAMHADQIAHSIGPLILLYCVSLVLCFARLATRSLAASTLVHATYNFILFFFMLVGTGGFKHLDKM